MHGPRSLLLPPSRNVSFRRAKSKKAYILGQSNKKQDFYLKLFGALAPVFLHGPVLNGLHHPRGRRETFSTGFLYGPLLKILPIYTPVQPALFLLEGVRGVC
jgi:hypothetical protein